MSNTAKPEFSLGESGLTRFPPNVEQLGVETGPTHVWLTARLNDVKLRFPLRPADVEHLCSLLRKAVDDMGGAG